MIYFDTDVLVHYLVQQDGSKNQQAVELYKNASEKGLFFCSLLCLQESAYVLSRLEVPTTDISLMISLLMTSSTINYSAAHYLRAMEIANHIGFKNINDCLHTAIAETFCTELYTYNRSDFKQIQKFTTLKISML